MHTYYIALQKGEDRDQFHADMESSYPGRRIEIGNHTTSYSLTEEEAALILAQERVFEVERENSSVEGSTWTRTGTYSKSQTNDATHENWGLYRAVRGPVDGWGSNTATPGVTATVTLAEEGSGVRFLIWDGHIQEHPEFENVGGFSGSFDAKSFTNYVDSSDEPIVFKNPASGTDNFALEANYHDRNGQVFGGLRFGEPAQRSVTFYTGDTINIRNEDGSSNLTIMTADRTTVSGTNNPASQNQTASITPTTAQTLYVIVDNGIDSTRPPAGTGGVLTVNELTAENRYSLSTGQSNLTFLAGSSANFQQGDNQSIADLEVGQIVECSHSSFPSYTNDNVVIGSISTDSITLVKQSNTLLPAQMTGTLPAGQTIRFPPTAGQTRIPVSAANFSTNAATRAEYVGRLAQSTSVSHIEITNGGSEYTSAPTVTIAAPPSGTTATATAQIESGSVVRIDITDAGTGYSSAPTVTISAPSGESGVTATATAHVTPSAAIITSVGTRSIVLGEAIPASTGKLPDDLVLTTQVGLIINVIDSPSRRKEENWGAYANDAYSGTNFTYNYSLGTDSDKNHGTGVAGLCAGKKQGMAPEATVYSINPFTSTQVPSNSGSVDRKQKLMKLVKEWAFEGNNFNPEDATDKAEEHNPVVFVMPYVEVYVSPLYDDSNKDTTFCRLSDITTLKYGPVTDTSVTESDANSAKLALMQPRGIFRTTAAFSSGATSFTGFYQNINEQDFMSKSFTNGATWDYAASNAAMVGRSITGATATGNNVTYNGTTYEEYTFTLDAGTSASGSNNFGFTFEYSEKTVKAPMYQSSTLKGALEDLLDMGGFHVVSSANNQAMYLAEENDVNWDNHIVVSGTTYYYNRPQWNQQDPRITVVGAMDTTSTEQKIDYSSFGPRVDVYAPTFCQTASTNADSNAVAYEGSSNANYKYRKLTGTSASDPFVAGVLGAGLEKHPYVTAEAGKRYVIGSADEDVMTESSTFTDSNVILGNNRIVRTGDPINFATAVRLPRDRDHNQVFYWFGSVVNENKTHTFDKLHVAKDSRVVAEIASSDNSDHEGILDNTNYVISNVTNCVVKGLFSGVTNPTISGKVYPDFAPYVVDFSSSTPGQDASFTITHTHGRYQSGTPSTFTKTWNFSYNVGAAQGVSDDDYGIQIWKKEEKLYPRLDSSDEQLFHIATFTGTLSVGGSKTFTSSDGLPSDFDMLSDSYLAVLDRYQRYVYQYEWELQQPQVGQLKLLHGSTVNTTHPFYDHSYVITVYRRTT